MNNAASPRNRAVLYARVSTENPAEYHESIAEQVRAIRGWAARYGYDVVTEYIELGQGAMDDDRPIFQSMLEDLSQDPKPAEAILIHTTSRFMRNASHARTYKRDLEERSIQVIAVAPDATTLCWTDDHKELVAPAIDRE